MHKLLKKTELSPGSVMSKNDPSGESLFRVKGNDTTTLIDYYRAINIDSKAQNVRLTPIICSIGAASRDLATLEQMVEAGMNVARLNFSHGTKAYHVETIANIRKAVEEVSRKTGINYTIGIAIDLKGPKIQTGFFEAGESAEVELKKGANVKLTTDQSFAEKGTIEYIFIDYYNIIKLVKVGGKVLLDHGSISLTIIEVGMSIISCIVEHGGILGNQKGVQFPGVVFDLPSLTSKDRGDLQFAIDYELDMIFAPFIRNSSAVHELRYILGERGKHILIFSKIENYQGMNHIDEIIMASDGIIISRGDLSSVIPPETVVTAQKTVIARCNMVGKPVICATQVLESMMKKPRPTRVEIADVANAILNGVDCLMLSGETESGQYPVDTIRKLDAICKEAEFAMWQKQRFSELVSKNEPPVNALDVIAMATVRASIMCRAASIIVITKSGGSAQIISKYRPRCPILAVLRYKQTARQHQVYRGIMPVLYKDKPLDDWPRDVDSRFRFGVQFGLNKGFIKIGDQVIIVAGWKKGSRFTNTMRIMNVSTSHSKHDAWGHR